MNRSRALSAHVTAALAIILTLGAAACSEPGEGSDGATSQAPLARPTRTGPAAPSVTPTATATYPTDRAGAAMQWFVGQMNTDPVEPDLGERFSAEFTDQVPREQILVLIGEMRLQGPWVTENTATEGSGGHATLVSGQGMRYTLSMQLDQNGLIAGMLIDSAPQAAATSP